MPCLLLVACLLAIAGLVACGPLAAATAAVRPSVGATPASGGSPATAERLKVQVLAAHPHDATSFTEGLLLSDGMLYESGGLYGESKLEAADPETGAILQQIRLAPEFFGEGLALVDGRLIQLTWNEGTAFVYDAATFATIDQYSYDGEGWGLCYDGSRLVMSNGSDTLTFRDPTTFEPIGQVPVTLDGQPIERINELECVDDSVYANVWLTDEILRIDEATGRATGVIDASGLLTPAEHQSADVLNGIAYDPGTGHFLITGKRWPKLFEVNFVPL